MSNTTIAFIFVMTLNILLFISQVAMVNISDSPTTIFNCEGSLVDIYGNCDNLTISEDPSEFLPGAEGTLTPSTGSIFTDVFNNILSWIKDLPGVNYLVAIVLAPYTLFKAMLLPAEISFILGTMWYGISIFLLVSFLWGRE